jgi:hypothetical protein
VDELVVEIREVELFSGGSEVAFLVEIALEMAVDRGHQGISSNVELSFVN